MSAAQIGWVATSAVDDATVVNRNDGIQVAKCAARNKPAITMSFHSRRSNAANSRRLRHSTQGIIATEPRKQRQNAMAKAGAAVTAMSGPDVEMNATAMPKNSRSRPWGRCTADGCIIWPFVRVLGVLARR